MSQTVSVKEAQDNFNKLLDDVAAGEKITVVKSGKPVARIVPVKVGTRKPGSAKGKIVIMPDFDDPLPDEILSSFEN